MAAPSPDYKLIVLVVSVVTLVWAVAVIAALLTGDLRPALTATPLVGAVVGWITGVRIWRQRNGGGE